jgi:hypothetical protein
MSRTLSIFCENAIQNLEHEVFVTQSVHVFVSFMRWCLQPTASSSADTNYSVIQWTLPVTLIVSVCVAERPCLSDAVH